MYFKSFLRVDIFVPFPLMVPVSHAFDRPSNEYRPVEILILSVFIGGMRM